MNAKKSEIDDVEGELRELRRKWNEHLVEIEDTQ